MRLVLSPDLGWGTRDGRRVHNSSMCLVHDSTTCVAQSPSLTGIDRRRVGVSEPKGINPTGELISFHLPSNVLSDFLEGRTYGVVTGDLGYRTTNYHRHDRDTYPPPLLET